MRLDLSVTKNPLGPRWHHPELLCLLSSGCDHELYGMELGFTSILIRYLVERLG